MLSHRVCYFQIAIFTRLNKTIIHWPGKVPSSPNCYNKVYIIGIFGIMYDYYTILLYIVIINFIFPYLIKNILHVTFLSGLVGRGVPPNMRLMRAVGVITR